jgi:2-haloacid dehalogenase
VPRVCLFDVNETLLDLRALDPHFERAFGDATVRAAWFTQLIESALVSTVTDTYAPFGDLARAALQMVADRRATPLSHEDRDAILAAVGTLPPHPEVEDALRRLRGAGIAMATLTNSTQAVAEAQLTNAGLAPYFEQFFSADSVRRLKPAPEPYRMAADRLGVQIGELRLVAAHAWDVAGARRAGCAAAFVSRPGKVLDPLVEPPDVVGRDLREVAERIINVEAGRTR